MARPGPGGAPRPRRAHDPNTRSIRSRSPCPRPPVGGCPSQRQPPIPAGSGWPVMAELRPAGAGVGPVLERPGSGRPLRPPSSARGPPVDVGRPTLVAGAIATTDRPLADRRASRARRINPRARPIRAASVGAAGAGRRPVRRSAPAAGRALRPGRRRPRPGPDRRRRPPRGPARLRRPPRAGGPGGVHGGPAPGRRGEGPPPRRVPGGERPGREPRRHRGAARAWLTRSTSSTARSARPSGSSRPAGRSCAPRCRRWSGSPRRPTRPGSRPRTRRPAATRRARRWPRARRPRRAPGAGPAARRPRSRTRSTASGRESPPACPIRRGACTRRPR